jgi:hypothetical protein
MPTWGAANEDRPLRYAITEKGERKEKASPELLPEHLRVLPSDLVTKEIEVEDRVHAEDPKHIVKALASDYADKELGKKPHDPNAEPEGPKVESKRLTQEAVDVRRLSVMRRWATTQKERILNHKPVDMGVKHLCFPDPDSHEEYGLHDGNQSACIERVSSGGRIKFCQHLKHLKGLELEIDLGAGQLPGTIVEKLRAKGIPVTNVHEQMVRKAMNLNRVLTANGETWE